MATTFLAGQIVRASVLNSVQPLSLGYIEVTAPQTGIGGTETDITGLSVTVNVAAGRRIRISAYSLISATATGIRYDARIREGADEIAQWVDTIGATPTASTAAPVRTLINPPPGTHTYRVTLVVVSGSGTVGINPAVTAPAFIEVEDRGPA